MTQVIQAQYEHRRLYTQFIESGEVEQALDYISEVMREFPDSELRLMRPSCLKNIGRYQEAYDYALELLAQDISPWHQINLWDVLSHACAMIHKKDEAKYYGLLALQAKSEQPPTAPIQKIPTDIPLSTQPEYLGAWVIAFSLYGDNPRYGEGAVLNVLEAKKWLPEWVCRFYCDASVPENVTSRLQAAGAQVYRVNARWQKSFPGTFWRMLVVDDPTVERFLQRDADSMISEREALAVQEWIDSDCVFHAMRDGWSHSELLLAGMWGGSTFGLNGMAQLIKEFFAQRPQHFKTRIADQLFLRTSIWPTVQQSLLTHDRYFGFRGRPFAAHAPVMPEVFNDFHVGMNIAGCPLEVASNLPEGTRVEWMVHDGTQELCRYSSLVKQGIWQASLPSTYFKPLVNKVWRVCPVNHPDAPYRLLKPRELTAKSQFIKKSKRPNGA